MSNKEKKDGKKMENAAKALEILVGLTDVHGHYQDLVKLKENMATIKHEVVYEAPKKQLSQKEIALEKMKSLNSIMESGNEERQKEKKRRLELLRKEATAQEAINKREANNRNREEIIKKRQQLEKTSLEKATRFDHNKKDVFRTDQKQSDVQFHKNGMEQKQKDNKTEVIQKKSNERK